VKQAARSAAAALFALSLAACGGDDSAAPHVAAAEAAITAGKPDEALLALRKALQAEPKNADVNYRLARLLHQQEQIPDAVYFYEEALRLDPNHADAALTLAFLMIGDDAAYAERLTEGVLARDPKNALAYVRRSDIALARGDADGALAAALTAAELEPKNARVQIQAGLVQRARIRRLNVLGEPVPDALYEEALAAFERAAQGEDDSPVHETVVSAWIERANTLASWNARKADAPAAFRAAFDFAQKAGGSQDRVLDAAINYARVGRDPALRRWAFERSVELHPERTDLWRRLARIVDAKDAKRSSVLERMLEVRAKDARAHAAFARDLAVRDNADAGLAHLDQHISKVDSPAILLAAKVELAIRAGRDDLAEAAGAELAKNYAGSLEDLVGQAELLRRKQDFRGAADSLAKAVDAFGATASLLQRLAELRLLQGDFGAALEATERGLAQGATTFQEVALLRIQARAQLARGASAAAAESFRRASEVAKGTLTTADVVPYAQALYGSDRSAAARGLLEQLLAQESPPLDAVLLFARAEGANDPKRAEALVQQALATAPGHPALLEAAAGFDLAAGRTEQARTRLESAVAAAPSHAPLHLTLARVLLQTGDAKGAATSAEEAMRLAPDAPDSMAARVLLAAYDQLGKTAEATAKLQATHAKGELGLGSQVLLARLLIASGEYDKAEAILEAVMKASPQLPGPKNDLAYLLVLAGRDLDRALSLAQEARAALPKLSNVADTLGFAYLAKGLPDAALPQFDEAIGLAQQGSAEWGLAQLHRAQALRELERVDDARKAAQAALGSAVFPEQAQAKQLLAELANA
jgi:tetratricopeptide (TPR) repeat protein